MPARPSSARSATGLSAPGFAAAEPARPRPLLGPAIALMAGIALAERIGPVSVAVRAGLPVLAGVCFALLAWRVHRRRGSGLAAVLGAAIALIAGFQRHQLELARPPQHIAHVVGAEPILTRVAGRIVTPPLERPAIKHNPFLPFEPPPRTQFVLEVEQLLTENPPLPAAGRLRVTVEDTGLGLRLGQRVEVAGELALPVGPRNPGAADWRAWHRQQGLSGVLLVERAELVRVGPEPPGAWPRLVEALRARARGLLLEPGAALGADEAAQLLDVMILGQRSVADRRINEAFLKAGGLHFLAVSGFNVAVLAGFTAAAMRWGLRCGRRTTAGATLAVTLLFALVTEQNAPVLRAAGCVLLATAAVLTGRPLSPLNWLAAAVIGVLLWNPWELFRAGFQLSFVQVLGLILVVPPVYRAALRWTRRGDAGDGIEEADTVWKWAGTRLGRGLLGLVVGCTCAYAIAQPLVLWHFGRLAPWGIVGTIVLTVPVAFVTVLSLVTLVANLSVPPLGGWLAVGLHALTEGLLGVVGLAERLPAAALDVPRPPLWLVAGSYVLVLVVLAIPARVRSGRLVTAALLLSGAAWTGWALWPAGSDAFEVDVLSVADGSAVLLRTPGGRAAVFDVGTNTNSDAGEVVLRALRAVGARRVDLICVSHANFDHYSGLATLLAGLPATGWCTNRAFAELLADGEPAKLARLLPRDRARPQVVAAGERLSVGGATVEVLWPPPTVSPEWGGNDSSLVLRITVAGRSVLLTGDAEEAALRALLARERAGRIDLHADVLVAPHHGQVIPGVSGEFYAAVSPRHVVVSARRERPRLTTLVEHVLGPGAAILRTGGAGAIRVRITQTGELTVGPADAGGG